jgi:DNA polymerase III subunit epsilon
MARFLAIDFETANYQSDSACSVGLVRVEDKKIVSKKYFLIRPPYQNFAFTYVHGLTWKHVENAPSFPDVWNQVEDMFEGIDFIAAHNASFDRRVLSALCQRYKIGEPKSPYVCTVRVAKNQLGINPANLPAVCKSLKIPLKHHDAISDAMACARIVLAASTVCQ